MTKKIFLAIIPLFLLGFVNNALAYDVTSCQNITSSGFYQFTQNITVNDNQCTYSWGCIVINASDVTLDLKGHSLINNGSCSYGVVIPAYQPSYSNINILNGNLIHFTSAGVEVVGTTDSCSFTQLGIYDVMNGGDGISVNSGNDTNLLIGSNLFSHLYNAVIGTCGGFCKLHDNVIKFVNNGFYLYGNGFDVQRNLMGFSTWNNTVCFTDDWPILSGIYCNDCNYTVIKNNDIMSLNALTLTGGADHNNITDNTFRTFYNYQPILTFDSTTSSNIFCNNQVIESEPYLYYIWGVDTCYHSTTVTNAIGHVVDQGTNTISELCTSDCLGNWYCQDRNRVYINSSCIISSIHHCQYSCESGITGSYCIGTEIVNTTSTTTTTILPNQITNITWHDSIINQTDLNDAGLKWIAPFTSPFFIILASTVIGCAILTGLTKSPIVFPLSLLGFTLIFWFYQMLPNLIAILLILLEAIGSATLFKNQLAK
jgi:hypothetical protein